MRLIASLFVLVVISSPCFAQRPDPQKLREARLAAQAMVRPSGPLRVESPASRTAGEWRARPRLVGTYSNYSQRDTFVLPFAPYYCGWGYGYGFGGYGFGWGCGIGRGWGLVYGYSTW